MFSAKEIQFLCVLLYVMDCVSDFTPRGHLQPLGSHRPPDVIEERSDVPDPLEFWTKYVKLSKPVVLRGAASHSKAFRLWTDDYLKESYGKLEVRLERKKEISAKVPVGAKGLGRDTIENFIDHYHETNHYIVSELPTPMWDDISVQPCLTCGTFAQRLVEIDLWMSGGGSKSVLHKDAFNAMNCLYNGTKQWKIIEYKYENMLYKAWEPYQPVETGGYSEIDVNAVDLKKYPKIVDVPWSYVEVNAGDCLFLPKSYYHQVDSLGPSNIAVAILFSRLDGVDHYDNTGCDASQLQYVPLSQMDVDWKYPGYGNLSMGNAELEMVRDLMKDRMNDEGLMTLEDLKSLFQEFSYGTINTEAILEQAFKLITNGTASYITQQDIASLSRDDLRTLVLMMERYEPSNTYTYEYSFVSAADIRSLVVELIKQDNAVILSKFVKRYTEELGGSEKYALQIFRGFLPVNESMATADEVSKRLDSLLKPYVEYGLLVKNPDEDEQDEHDDSGEELDDAKDEL